MKSRGLIFFLTGIAASLAIGWLVFPLALYKTELQPVQFSHKVHTGEQVGLSCESCHEFAEEGRYNGIPSVAKCSECHAAQLGATSDEKNLVENYVMANREIPWKVYSRQPDNAYFSHATHIKLGNLQCADCHGPHGSDEALQAYQVNRITGYSRDIWGRNISGIPSKPWEGMKMDRCVQCHAQRNRVDGCIDCHK